MQRSGADRPDLAFRDAEVMERSENSLSLEADGASDRYYTQFNSTTVLSIEETSDVPPSRKPDLKLSPIFCDGDRRTVFTKRMPLGDISEIRTENAEESNIFASSNDAKGDSSNKENDRPGTSTPERDVSIAATPFIRSTNSFESRLLETLHTNTFSPSVFAASKSPLSPEEFKWSIEELSLLKPVNITEEEIAQSSQSPDPEYEAKIQSILDEYWKNNVCHIPSPDAPVTNPLLTAASETPLCDIVRISAAMRMKYSTSSPKSRPNLNGSRRSTAVVSSRSRHSQTEITIAPSVHFDFAKFLGSSCIYNSSEDCDEESVFNATGSSIGSLRRRLFIDDAENASPHGSADDLHSTGSQSLDNSQDMIRCDLDGNYNSTDGFGDIDISPIKHMS
ncbi:hypothetical protein KIN20_032242 [Parelaphostrongylus tenuis]|uniref:Protein aurora borealis n=1 Tax=Parelaphostrongylus tenuis TaxID=148309 RepID=A0AAD5R6Z5_PARTN|nr:hypothetical protein KIN20_032242 [Parelaphostrongylus tenuis]